MVAVIDRKLVFGREQVLTSTQASKNFGEARRRARREPQFVSDRNDGIDTEASDPVADAELFE